MTSSVFSVRELREMARIKHRSRGRVRFHYVSDGVPLYPRPCGCEAHPHYLPTGVRGYQYDSDPVGARDDDLVECLICGAVWTDGDVRRCYPWPTPGETKPETAPCPYCKGRGWHHGDCHPQETCGVCNGHGRIPKEIPR